ncbi:slipin family protein [Leptospira koniambonensis]|uniref:Slipin family protein n=1 Tax=Leptospira koniambonensis TaxID=2484950 RepID=A0A4V3JNE6_9LEPT|nr:slipin family protein [Leptospira koniambonensis]TGL34639.1 slipin family protein [Leptospira koniambonensis]
MTRILKHQRGLLFHRGDYKKLLLPGNHFVSPFDFVKILDASLPFTPDQRQNIYLEDAELKSQLEIFEVKDNEIVILYAEGIFKKVLEPGNHFYWKGLHNYTFQKFDLNQGEIPQNLDKNVLAKPELSKFVSAFTVEPHEIGGLFIEKIFSKLLEPGTYYFWKGINSVSVPKLDLRRIQHEISGQELMTKDKINLRLNFVFHYRIVNSEKIFKEIKDFSEQIYIFLQLALREYIGNLTLDEILTKKEEIGSFVLEKAKSNAENLGLEILFAGVKDIILPGEIKDILNQVLIAEKKAQANIITRREETASTRSLLNTAKLMEENQVLFKLKELEYIERLSEKINQIQLVGGGHILDQLKGLLIPKSPKEPS